VVECRQFSAALRRMDDERPWPKERGRVFLPVWQQSHELRMSPAEKTDHISGHSVPRGKLDRTRLATQLALGFLRNPHHDGRLEETIEG